MRKPSEGRMAYEAVAEELSDRHIKLADLDAGTVKLAREYARKSHRRWPPKPATSGWQVTIQSLGDSDEEDSGEPEYGAMLNALRGQG